MRLLIFLFVSLLTLHIPLGSVAQSFINIRGQVEDADTKEKLPFAAIGIEGTSVGTASNSSGFFELRVRSDWKDKKLICSYVGYGKYEIEIAEAHRLSQKKQFVIRLSSSQKLSTVVVSTKKVPSVEKIMKRVLKNLDENHPQTPYSATLFYREHLKDSSAYVRLVEAALELYDGRAYQPRPELNRKKRRKKRLAQQAFTAPYIVNVSQIRSSYDYSKSRKHNFYIDTEYGKKYNWIRNREVIFDANLYKKLQYKLYQVTTLGDDIVYEIHFNYKGSIHRYRYLKGKLFVREDNYAVVQLHFDYIPIGTVGGYNPDDEFGYQVYQKNQEHFYFQEYEGKFLVSYQSLESIWYYYENSETFIESETTYFVEQLTTEVNLNPNSEPQEQPLEELKKLSYDEGFWKSYNVLADSPLDERIKADLDKRQSLENQFGIEKK